MEGMIGKRIKLIFDDGSDISQRVGILISVDASFLILKQDSITESFPISRVVRVEVLHS